MVERITPETDQPVVPQDSDNPKKNDTIKIPDQPPPMLEDSGKLRRKLRRELPDRDLITEFHRAG